MTPRFFGMDSSTTNSLFRVPATFKSAMFLLSGQLAIESKKANAIAAGFNRKKRTKNALHKCPLLDDCGRKQRPLP
jgi:hypothetical protein